MGKDEKQQLEGLAKYAEDQANASLDRAIKFGLDHGPQAGHGDLVSAGALFSAAAALRDRAK
jgi:hypothetical protein